VTPAPPGSRSGNRATAERWAAILADLGYAPSVVEELRAQPCDLLIALHARRSAPSVERYRAARPGAPLIIACTGTDLYRDLPAGDAAAERSIHSANRLVVLHPLALEALPDALRPRTRVIVQSVRLPPDLTADPVRPRPGHRRFRIVIAAHLREIKDPLRAAHAARLLPADSAIEIVHLGRALDPALGEEAERLAAGSSRYQWIGEVAPRDALEMMAVSHALVITSLAEGAPNVLSEALALRLPVIASDIPGCTGILGPDHPALFPAGDTRALARLLHRVETDAVLYQKLRERSESLSALVRPEREKAAWRRLLAELGFTS